MNAECNDAGFTLDTYSHIISGMQDEAMALIDEVLPEGMLNGAEVSSLWFCIA